MARTHIARGFNGFPHEAFDFFEQLARSNKREWFQAHKEVYERACREPMEQLVAELGAGSASARISRINRDIRFSPDKSPYRTNISAGFDGNYISLSTAGLYVGAGVYKLEPAALGRFRSAIDSDVSGPPLDRVVRALRRKHYQVDTHERLASVPRGYTADHPRIDLLRMKDIFAGKAFAREAWLSTPSALDRIARVLSDVKPLADWLQVHVGACR
jgi:uncharacterized protein (TIGR02453 family)